MSDIHVHVHVNLGAEVLAPITQQLKEIVMDMTQLQTTLATVASDLGAVSTQLDKATNEIVLAISNAGNTTPAVDAAVAQLQAVAAALRTASQGLDDLNPDAPPAA